MELWFEFVRNGQVNAIDYFATKQDSLKRNQFGVHLARPHSPRTKYSASLAIRKQLTPHCASVNISLLSNRSCAER